MNWATLVRPSSWLDKSIEWSWQTLPAGDRDEIKLTWPLDPERLKQVTVFWPTRYQWHPRKIWGDQIFKALRRFVTVQLTDVEQPYQGVITFQVRIDGRVHRVNIETSDYPELNETAYDDCDLHFKMEYQLGGYGDYDRLLPGGYVNADSVIYAYLPRLRRMRDELPARYDVYGRYSLSMEKRRRPLSVLSESSLVRFHGGKGKVRYSRFLREVARASVVIDLPSMASITFRLMDYFAVGSCVVGPRHTCQLQIPFVDRVHLAYCRDDYSDLDELAAYYLENEDEREELVRNSRRFFDTYIHREQLASYYLYHMLERLS